jgi:hypothetical protein
MSSEERAWLEAFVVDNHDLERLEALLAEFNVFEALGAVRQELRHSDFLAFLLDPLQNHGLGDAFLKRFLKRVLVGAGSPPLSAVDIDVADLRGALVQREWRHIDILVHDPVNRLICAVENKIDSVEHAGQLRRYREIVAREFPNHHAIFIYLTPEGNEPSDENYIPFDYTQIAELTEAIRQTYESTLGPDVATLIAHYTQMLRRHIVSDSEIPELCQKIYRQHRQALDLIFEHRPDLQSDLAEVIKGLVKDAVEPYGLIGGHTSKRLIDFADAEWAAIPSQLENLGWTADRPPLLFEFENTSDQLRLRLYIRPLEQIPQPIRQAVFQFAGDHPKVFRDRSKHFTNRWPYIYRRFFLKQRDYEDADLESLAEKVKAGWQRFLTQDLPAIREALAQMTWPEAPHSAEG